MCANCTGNERELKSKFLEPKKAFYESTYKIKNVCVCVFWRKQRIGKMKITRTQYGLSGGN